MSFRRQLGPGGSTSASVRDRVAVRRGGSHRAAGSTYLQTDGGSLCSEETQAPEGGEGGCETEQPVSVRLALFICLLTRGLLPLTPPTPRGGDQLLWPLRPDGVARPVPHKQALRRTMPCDCPTWCTHSCFTGNILSIAEGKPTFGF